MSWLPCFLAYYPGITAYDTGNQIEQVLTGNYSTHHPLFHTFLVGYSYLFGKTIGKIQVGIALYCLVQMVILALALAYSLSFLQQRSVNKILRRILLVYYSFFPIHPMLADSVTKDVPFAAFWLLFNLFWIEFMEQDKISRKHGIGIFLTGIVIYLFRNNARYVLVIWGLLWGIMLWRHSRRKCRMGIILLLLVLGLGKGIEWSTVQLTHAQKGSVKEMLSVPIVQMGRCLAYSREEMDAETIREFETLNYKENGYNARLADIQKLELRYEGNERIFWRLYLKMLKKYPMTYVNAFLYLQQGAWSLDDITIGYVYSSMPAARLGYLETFTATGFGIEHRSLFPKLESAYERLFTFNGYQELPVISILFLPMFYIWLLLLSMLNRTLKKKTFPFGGLNLLYYLSLLLGPCSLIRYHYPIALVSVVLFCYEFGSNTEIMDLTKDPVSEG